MKKQRPTIPLGEWKVAIHLEASREIQNQKGIPAYNCDCEWCFNWKHCLSAVLTSGLEAQLSRIGVDLLHPTDLYKYDTSDQDSSIRVVYHAVGKILSGPNQWTSNEMGETLMYRTIRAAPHLSLVVLPQNQSSDESPVLKDKSSGELLRIDLRLSIPNEVVRSNAPKKVQ